MYNYLYNIVFPSSEENDQEKLHEEKKETENKFGDIFDQNIVRTSGKIPNSTFYTNFKANESNFNKSQSILDLRPKQREPNVDSSVQHSKYSSTLKNQKMIEKSNHEQNSEPTYYKRAITYFEEDKNTDARKVENFGIVRNSQIKNLYKAKIEPDVMREKTKEILETQQQIKQPIEFQITPVPLNKPQNTTKEKIPLNKPQNTIDEKILENKNPQTKSPLIENLFPDKNPPKSPENKNKPITDTDLFKSVMFPDLSESKIKDTPDPSIGFSNLIWDKPAEQYQEQSPQVNTNKSQENITFKPIFPNHSEIIQPPAETPSFSKSFSFSEEPLPKQEEKKPDKKTPSTIIQSSLIQVKLPIVEEVDETGIQETKLTNTYDTEDIAKMVKMIPELTTTVADEERNAPPAMINEMVGVIGDFFNKIASEIDDKWLIQVDKIIDIFDKYKNNKSAYLILSNKFSRKLIIGCVNEFDKNKVKTVFLGVVVQLLARKHPGVLDLIYTFLHKRFKLLHPSYEDFDSTKHEYEGYLIYLGFSPKDGKEITKANYKTQAQLKTAAIARWPKEAIEDFFEKLDCYSTLLFSIMGISLEKQLNVNWDKQLNRRDLTDLKRQQLLEKKDTWYPALDRFMNKHRIDISGNQFKFYIEYMKKLLKLPIGHIYFSTVIIKNWVILSDDLYTEGSIGNIHYKIVELIHRNYVPKLEEFCKVNKKPVWFHGSAKDFDDNMIVMRCKLKDIIEGRKNKKRKIINKFTEIDEQCRSESESEDNFGY